MTILPARLEADPQFADPEVNAYVKTLSDFRDRYMVAVTAAKNGDERDLKRMDAQFPPLQQKAIRLLDKLRPDETQRYTDYVTACGAGHGGCRLWPGSEARRLKIAPGVAAQEQRR